MATNKAKNLNPSVKPSVNPTTITPSNIASTNPKLTFISGKARATHNNTRAKSVNGYTYANALSHYATLGFKKVDLNYDIFKIKSLSTS
tara:strand:+ start:299 stop:565 length:267 start_codon:yes stop_codon:yes gene_type:complete